MAFKVNKNRFQKILDKPELSEDDIRYLETKKHEAEQEKIYLESNYNQEINWKETPAEDLKQLKWRIENLKHWVGLYDNQLNKRPTTKNNVKDGNKTGTKLKPIIDLAIKPLRKANKQKARDFMNQYYAQREANPGFNQSELVKEIDWTKHSANTQKDWMDKFDEAEKIITNSDQ